MDENKFLSIDKDKQIRIINACLEEFTLNGYDNASTNTIVKGANISKGILFHYFNSKKQLYLYIYDYALNIFTTEFYKLIDFDQKDLIFRVRQSVNMKLQLINKYPLIFKFLERANYEDSKTVKADLLIRNQELKKVTYKLFEDIALTKFRDDIDNKRLLNIIYWTIQGYTDDILINNQINKKEFIVDEILNEVESYLDIFKKLFYKTEDK